MLINNGEGFLIGGKAEYAGILNLVKVTEEVLRGGKLQVKLELQNLVIMPNCSNLLSFAQIFRSL